VRQGRLGSCYFHSVVAALARTKPEMIRGMIHENSDGTFTVQFGDGKKEITYPLDINYSRDNGYDKSEGLWVAVLFRAYAQRVLRESLAAAVNQSEVFALVKDYAGQLIGSNDSVLLAYDRAIRAVVDQYGNINRTKLESNLREQLRTIPIPEEIKNSLLTMLDSGGFFGTMEREIKQNGELFGAYRAVGQGGMAGRVMETLGGSKRLMPNVSESAAAAALEEATRAHSPMVACTGQRGSKASLWPCWASADCSFWMVQPASTLTVRSAQACSMILSRRAVERMTSARMGGLPQESFVPPPRGITARPASFARRRTAASCCSLPGSRTIRG